MQAETLLKPGETDPAAAGVLPDLAEHGPRSNPISGARLLAFTTGIIGVLVLGWTIGLKLTSDSGLSASAAASIAADNLDRSLQRAATLALANRPGAVIVMDPQTGR